MAQMMVQMTDALSFCFGPAELGSGQSQRVPPGLEHVATEFPTVAVERSLAGTALPGVIVEAAAWHRGDIDLYDLDYRIDELADHGRVGLRVVGSRALDVALEVLTRCQRWVGRRNAHSYGAAFDRILALHLQLHDRNKPLVRADYNHALDVWQWVLRLRPEASAAVQIAALFHDIERLVSEADERIEHRAVEYDAFKHAHAKGGAYIAYELLGTLGIDTQLREDVARLIERHERPPGAGERDPERALLNDADGLSFFSLNSSGFLDYYGLAHTRHKIAWTLARLGTQARDRLRSIRLRPDVAPLVMEARSEDD